ncbi:hypothetical protein FOA52_015471 [Chlamydomonas sp. UWO 241]|nr:hypothetical protein FOA52_015471 [Chlamydomonas sp. UWO 241]
MLLSQHDAQKALGARGRQGKKLRSRDHAVARDTNASLGCRCPGCGCRWCATGNRGEYKQRSLPLVADTVSVVNATPARGLVASPLPLPPRVARAVASALAARLALAQRLSESPWHAWRSSVSAGSMIITGGMRSAPVIHQPAVLPGLRPGNKVTCKIRSMPALQELYLEAAEAAPLRTTSAAAAATNAQQQLQRATYTLLTDGAWTPEGECTWGAVAAAPAAVAASPAAADTAAADAPSALPGAAGEDTGDELLDDEGFVLIEGPGLDLPLRIAAASATAVPEPPVLEMFPMPAAVPRTSQATITYNDFINDPQKEGAPADADADADADAAGLSCFARPPPLVIDLAALLQQAQSRPPRHRAKKDKARRIRVVAGQVQTALSADAEGYVLVDATVRSRVSGDDAEALAEAVAAASFLDETPGENRQRLRAARMRMRKLLLDAASGAATRSPHAKDEYSVAEFDDLSAKYQSLNWRMVARAGGATVRPDDFYRLYALHMQASQGDNTEERPMWAERGGLDFEGRARWDAWTAVKGMDSEKAKLRFVKLYYEFSVAMLYKDTRLMSTAGADSRTHAVAMLLSQHDAQKALGARGRQGKKLRSRDHAVARETSSGSCRCCLCTTGHRSGSKQRVVPLVADTMSVVNAAPACALASPLPLPPRVARAVASASAARLAQRLSESSWYAWRSGMSAGSMIITGGMHSAPVTRQPAVLPGLRPGNKVTCKIRSMPALQELYLEAAEAAPLHTAAAATTDAQQQRQRATYALLTGGAWAPEGECTWGAVIAAPAAVASTPAPAASAAMPSALPGANASDNAGDELLDDEGFVLIEGHGLDLLARSAAASATAVPEPPVLEMSPIPAVVPRTSLATITYNDFINDPQGEVGAPADADADADADAAGLSCFARPPPLVIDLAALLQQAQSRPPRHRAKKDKARRMRAAAVQAQTALSAEAEGYVLVDVTA